ncbi:MAG TPA: protein kinase [Polyangia bacterium]|nr:protein kinase [Polyangia bacterium]
MSGGKGKTPALDATLPRFARSQAGNVKSPAPSAEKPDARAADQVTPQIVVGTPIASPPPPDALVGSRLKHFELTRLLGRGGMGAVYLGIDTSLERPVAIKVLDPEIGIDSETVARFVREARAQAQLGHTNITQIYFIGEDRGVHFFAMEYIEGTPLDVLLGRGDRLDWVKALEHGIAAARGLKAAFAKGFIHRDVKPSNLLVDKDGQVKIADFGLVKSMRGDAQLTRQGVIVGSPLYMAPEQSRAEEVDHRSDIYSLGCTMYHLIAGQPPFDNPSPVAVMSMHVTDRATRLRALRPEVPESMERLIDRMMAKDARNRFASYDELIAAMEAALPGRREHTGFWMRTAALGIDLALVGVTSLLLGRWSFLLAAVYFILMHRFLGQTAGKWLLKLQVTDRDGKRLGWKAASIRYAVFAWGPIAWIGLGTVLYYLHRDRHISFTLSQLKWDSLLQPLLYLALSAIIFLGYLGGFLLAAFHPKKLALHDLLARTEVTYKTRSLK